MRRRGRVGDTMAAQRCRSKCRLRTGHGLKSCSVLGRSRSGPFCAGKPCYCWPKVSQAATSPCCLGYTSGPSSGGRNASTQTNRWIDSRMPLGQGVRHLSLRRGLRQDSSGGVPPAERFGFSSRKVVPQPAGGVPARSALRRERLDGRPHPPRGHAPTTQAEDVVDLARRRVP